MLRGSKAMNGLLTTLAALLLAVLPLWSNAQLLRDLPENAQKVKLNQRIGESIPLELTFTDIQGKEVVLSKYYTGERPVVLFLGYYGCPQLCGLVMNGLIESLTDVTLTAGKDFDLLVVSIDPTERPPLARAKREEYLRYYNRPEAGRGFHFLTGREENIRALADAVGFEYGYDEAEREYAHGAVVYVTTPNGTISRYLIGVRFEPQTVRLSIVEASEGKTGSFADAFLLFCYTFDHTQGRYSLAAMNLMRAGGILTMLILGIAGYGFWKQEKAKRLDSDRQKLIPMESGT